MPSFCIPMLAPLSLCKSDQKDSWSLHRWHIQGTWMCRAEEPRAACPSLLPARLLPPTLLQGRHSHGASWQAAPGLHHSASSRSKLPALGMAIGTACPVAPLEKVQHIPTSTRGDCSAPAPGCHALVSHPPQLISHQSTCLWQGTVPPCQTGGGRRVWVKGTATRLGSQGTMK